MAIAVAVTSVIAVGIAVIGATVIGVIATGGTIAPGAVATTAAATITIGLTRVRLTAMPIAGRMRTASACAGGKAAGDVTDLKRKRQGRALAFFIHPTSGW